VLRSTAFDGLATLDLAKYLSYNRAMIGTKVKIGELRDHLSEYLSRAEQGETILVVNRDREVAVLSAVPRPRREQSLLGWMKGTARIQGDLLEPMLPSAAWFED